MTGLKVVDREVDAECGGEGDGMPGINRIGDLEGVRIGPCPCSLSNLNRRLPVGLGEVGRYAGLLNGAIKPRRMRGLEFHVYVARRSRSRRWRTSRGLLNRDLRRRLRSWFRSSRAARARTGPPERRNSIPGKGARGASPAEETVWVVPFLRGIQVKPMQPRAFVPRGG